MKYVDVYSTYHSSIAQSNRDDSQKLFALSKMHALYLFQDKTEDELLTETTLITSYYQLVLTTVAIQRQNPSFLHKWHTPIRLQLNL